MDVLSNGRTNSQSACNKRKRKSTSSDSSDLSKPIKRSCTEEYSCDSIPSSDHYSSSPIATPPSVSNVLSPPDTTFKQESEFTSHVIMPHESVYDTTVSCFVTPVSELRLCPLPALSWAESKDVWKLMCRKDEKASLERNPEMLTYHPGLQPRMRAILLDWLIEVCDVYKLHRETYYLAVDYLDRFLSVKNEKAKTPKTRLQLIGITCLFVAAKVEEIYPPKIGEFAYVTDGACEEEDIIHQEQILLSALGWKTSPVTIIGWLSVYMQLYVSNRTPKTLPRNFEQSVDVKEGDAFLFPQYSGLDFVRAAKLLDLCTLDIEIASFSYSVLAAAAISHTMNKSIALKVSGLEWNIIDPCFRWMQPYSDVICESSSEIFLLEKNEQVDCASGLRHVCPNINTDDSHTIQTHNTSLTMLDKANALKEKNELSLEKIVRQEASPAQIAILTCPEGLLTPPASIRKSSENIEPNIIHPKKPYQ